MTPPPRIPPLRPAAPLAAAFGLALLVLAACTPQERVTQYKPFFTGLSGAQFNTQPVDAESSSYADPTATPDGRIVINNPDGSRTLLCRSVRSLMSHIERELDEENSDIIIKQLISKRTIEEFEGRGESPAAIIDFLQKHRRDIAMFFARMPMAERSPTVILKQPGNGVWVLQLTGAASEDIRFTKLWVVMERGSWKFYWVT